MDGTANRLQAAAATLGESAWLAALVATPMLFNARADRPFEEPKVLLLRAVAGVVLAALVMCIIANGRRAALVAGRSVWHVPVVAPLLGLTAVYLVSTLLSLDVHVSFWGGYLRAQGTYTWLSYVAVFAAMLCLVRRRDQIERVRTALVLSSLPPALYGVLQHFGADPFRWDPSGDRHGRIVGTAGNPIFLGGFLIMVVPVTLACMIQHLIAARRHPVGRVTGGSDRSLAATYATILALQLLAIAYSQSIGPILGFAAGVLLFGMILSFQHRRQWSFTAIVGAATAVAICLTVFNLPPSVTHWRHATLGRIDMAAGTGKVRTLIWDAALDVLAADLRRDLIGYGPETAPCVFEAHTPAALMHYDLAAGTPDRAHNETLDALVTVGVIGAVAQLVMFGSLFVHMLRWLGLIATSVQCNGCVAAMAIGGSVGVGMPIVLHGGATFSAFGLAVGMVAGLAAYVFANAVAQWRRPAVAPGPHALLLLALVAAIAAHFVEIHLGISVVATRLYFFVCAALAVLIGMGVAETNASVTAMPAVAPRQSGSEDMLMGTTTGIMLIVLTFDFYRPGIGLIDQGMAFPLVLASTWIAATVLALGAAPRGGNRRLNRVGRFAVASLSIWLAFTAVYGHWNAAPPLIGSSELQTVRDFGRHMAHSVTILYAFVLASVALPAAFVASLTPGLPFRAQRPRRWQVPLCVLLAIAVLMMARTNLDGARADVTSKLASVYEERAQWAAAGALYDDAFRLQPSTEEYLLSVARVRMAQAGALDAELHRDTYLSEAQAALQRARAVRPLHPQPIQNLARLHRLWASLMTDATARADHLAQAQAWYAQALARSPTNVPLWNEWATLDLEQGQAREAVAKLDRSIAVDEPDTSRNAETYRLRAQAYLQLDAADAALADYESALTRDPTLLEAWSGKALALIQRNRLADAIAASRVLLSLAPDDMPTHRNLAVLYRQIGQLDQAVVEAQTALALAAPADEPPLRQLLAQLNAERTARN